MLSQAFLAGLSEQTSAALRQLAQSRAFEAGATLLCQGDPPHDVYEIDAGQVKTWRVAESGTALVLGHLRPGAIIGLTAVIGSLPHIASATTLTPVMVRMWNGARLRELAAEDAVLAMRFATRMARNAASFVTRLEEVSAAGVEERLARILMRMASEIEPEGGGAPVHVCLNQSEMAELAQTTVPTVSRLLGRWRTDAIVASGRGSIDVLDLQALAAIARKQV